MRHERTLGVGLEGLGLRKLDVQLLGREFLAIGLRQLPHQGDAGVADLRAALLDPFPDLAAADAVDELMPLPSHARDDPDASAGPGELDEPSVLKKIQMVGEVRRLLFRQRLARIGAEYLGRLPVEGLEGSLAPSI